MRRSNDRQHRLTIALPAAGLAMALLLAACADAEGPRPEGSAAEAATGRGAEARQDAAPDDDAAVRTNAGETASAMQHAATPATEADPDVAGSAAGDDSDEAKAAANGWLADPPTLLGIAVGDRERDVREALGKPADEYGIAEPEPLTILEYDGYSVGIGGDGRVRFVEAHGEDVPAGLGNLAVGGTADDAREALGEPASATAVVLRYDKDDVTLKLDLDPKSKKIALIRLFAE